MLHDTRFDQHAAAVRLLGCNPGDIDAYLGVCVRALDHVLAAHTKTRIDVIEQLEVPRHILSAVRNGLILALHGQREAEEVHVDGARKRN